MWASFIQKGFFHRTRFFQYKHAYLSCRLKLCQYHSNMTLCSIQWKSEFCSAVPIYRFGVTLCENSSPFGQLSDMDISETRESLHHDVWIASKLLSRASSSGGTATDEKPSYGHHLDRFPRGVVSLSTPWIQMNQVWGTCSKKKKNQAHSGGGKAQQPVASHSHWLSMCWQLGGITERWPPMSSGCLGINCQTFSGGLLLFTKWWM